MMKKLILLFLAMAACVSASAQNWTTVTAANITDLNQQKLAAGQLCFLATDQNDNPISIGIGGGGQLLRRAFCATVSNGAVSGFSVPNPAVTAPAGIMYRVTVNDTSVGKEVLRYTQVAFAGATFNFDAYAPTGPGPLPPLGSTVNGNLNVNGNLSITGSFATSQFGNIKATSYNSVIEADAQPGADACAQIAAAIAALPATGGTVDASGIQGAQTCAANPFASSTKPVQLLLGGVTITTSACWAVPSNTAITGAGRGISTLRLANGVNSCFVISNLHPSTGDNHIAVTGLTIDGNMLNQSPTGSQRTGCVFFERTQYFWIENNELLNCYNFSVEALGQSQYGWVRANRIDGTLAGSGVLFGNGPLSTDGTGAIAEVYDMWAEDNWIGNTADDCLFTTGSNTAAAYGTARVHFKNNTLSNCGDVSIEIGDSSRDSEAVGNIIQMPPPQALTSISRAANVVTATLAAPCNQYITAAPFTVSGVSYAGATAFNGTTFTVSTVTHGVSSCTLTWAQTGENGIGSGGLIVRRGNLALLSRSGLNHSFTANVVNGNSAGQQGCEMAWGNSGDNGPRDENVNFDDVCNNSGGDAFTTTAATSGQVNQIVHKSKIENTSGNDYVIGTNTQHLSLYANGFITAGSAQVGTSFAQSDNLAIAPTSGGNIQLAAQTAVGGQFTPSTTLHVRSTGNFQEAILEATTAGNEGISIKNTLQNWGIGVRNDLSQKFNIRNVTAGTDALLLDTSGNATFLGGVTASSLALSAKASTYNNLATAGIGVTPVYWTVGLTGQTASLATTNITASCSAGLYSLSYYLKTTTAGTAGTVSVTLNWNDGTAMTVTSATASLSSTTGLSQGTQVIKCGAASTVSYSTTVTGVTGSPQYSLDIAIEQLK